MPEIKTKLFIFFSITVLGSILTSIGCFLEIEAYFHSLPKLAWALSLNTLFGMGYSYLAYFLLERINVKQLFLTTQIIGIIGTCILIISFYRHEYLLLILGLAFNSFSSSNMQVSMTFTLKSTSTSDLNFRKQSGTREVLLGLLKISGAIITPLLLFVSTINTVFFIDILSYIIGLIPLCLLPPLEMHHNKKLIQTKPKNHNLLQALLMPQSYRFITYTTASMLLIGLIPLLASSNQFNIINNLPSIFKQSLWSIDGLTVFLGSFVYLILAKIRYRPVFNMFLTINGIFLLFSLCHAKNLIIPALLVTSFTIYLSFTKFRDDYVISAENNFYLSSAFSAISNAQRNLVCFFSPLLLTLLISYLNWAWTIISICIIQIGLTAVGNYVFRYTTKFLNPSSLLADMLPRA